METIVHKMSSSKILTCKEILWQVFKKKQFIRVCRLGIQSVILVFFSSTQFCELLPLEPSVSFNYPRLLPPLPCVNKYTVYMYTVGGGGGRGLLGFGPQTSKHQPQSPVTG